MSAIVPRVLDAEHVLRLLAIPQHVRAGTGPRELLLQIASLVSAVLDAKVAFVSRRGASWVILAESAVTPALPASAPAWQRFTGAANALGHDVHLWEDESAAWTMVGLRQRPSAEAILVLEGDWRASTPALIRLSNTLLPAERTPSTASHAQLAVSSHRLARALSRVSGEREVCRTVLKHVVRALPCRIAAFAVPDEDGQLAILATHGYPLTLVEHLRIPPGTGVFGSVYQRGTPLRVLDVSSHPAIGHRRSRYRTDSFVAVPLVAGPEVLGVVALTDRLGGGVFSRDDLSSLRALVAPASLALSRERQRRQAERYALSAAIDPVSGLYNRRYFESRLEEEVQRARRSATPVALLMLDIDDFKGVNDRFGHLAGDSVIRGVAEILRRSVRAFDVCTRYGGEEFAVLMPGNGPESAAATAERIRQRVEQYQPDDPALAGLKVTASLGIAATADGAARELIEHADRALYAAKRSGKNQVRIELQ